MACSMVACRNNTTKISVLYSCLCQLLCFVVFLKGKHLKSKITSQILLVYLLYLIYTKVCFITIIFIVVKKQ